MRDPGGVSPEKGVWHYSQWQYHVIMWQWWRDVTEGALGLYAESANTCLRDKEENAQPSAEVPNCFVCDWQAEEITLTIGQAFDLAYKKFLESSRGDMNQRKQDLLLQKKVRTAKNKKKKPGNQRRRHFLSFTRSKTRLELLMSQCCQEVIFVSILNGLTPQPVTNTKQHFANERSGH